MNGQRVLYRDSRSGRYWRRCFLSIFLVIMVVLTSVLLCSCGDKKQVPISLTIWHVYGEQTNSPLNDMIEEFNETVGLERGINIQVTKVSDTNTLHEAVLASAKGEPGTGALPDLFVAYPKTVLSMEQSDNLVDYREYFSKQELDLFLPEFLEEGMIDDALKILPIAKSTEILFVNKTLFDRFAATSGAKLEDLSTWEGLFDTAVRYKEMTGNSFFSADYHFDYFQVGIQSLGGNFFTDDGVNFDDTFRNVWDPFARAAVEGAIWLGNGYATEAIRTADAVAAVASSAGVLYYADEVTYSDNTSEAVEIIARPCPVFKNGSKSVMQRGAGLCTVKSTPEREQAAMIFLKWLTEPERNVEFVTKCGYMPVTKEAFTDYLPTAVSKLEDPKYRSLYGAYLETQDHYMFYTPPHLWFYLDVETRFEKNSRQELTEKALMYEESATSDMTPGEKEKLLKYLVTESCDDFERIMR